MAQDFGTPVPPIETPKKRNTPLIIAIVVIVLLLCCCLTIFIFYQYLGDPIWQWLNSQWIAPGLFNLFAY